MKVFVIAVIAACISANLAQDCSKKMQDVHKCMEDSRKKDMDEMKSKFEAMKPKMEACFTDNGCTPPAKSDGKGGSSSGGKGEDDNAEAKQCNKALHESMKKNFLDCVKQSNPDFTFPAKGDEHKGGEQHKGGWDHKNGKKDMDGCKNKQQVRDCIRTLFEANKPSEDQKKAQFTARCNTKATCTASLDAACQAQMEKVKKSMCQCGQQQHTQADQIRASVDACKNVPKKEGRHGGDHKEQRSCDEAGKDYCKLGYDEFVKDHPHHEGGHGGSTGGH